MVIPGYTDNKKDCKYPIQNNTGKTYCSNCLNSVNSFTPKKSKIIIHITKSIVVLIIMTMLFSCKNDIEAVNSLLVVDSLPLEMARGIEILYSDSGKIQASLTGALMVRTEETEGLESHIEFPEGFKVVFYDSILMEKSQITADYGISYEAKKILEAKNNVVVLNLENHEQLNTEHLVWDQNKHIIFSDVFVKITTPDNVLYGDSLISDENFDNYTINNVSGEFLIETDIEEEK